jgi:spore maturation protein SpmB
MDTLAMHRTLTEAGIPDGQADAIIKVMQGGVATKHDLELLETRLGAKIDRLDNKVNLILVAVVLGVIAPAVVRFAFG